MNTKVNWTKVSLVVVLAVASLSSVAMSAPHPHGARRIILAADLCGEVFVSEWDQYLAAIDWADRGGTEVPFVLSADCVQDSFGLTASLAELGGSSGTRWEQYSAAIEGRELSLDAAPVRTVAGGGTRPAQFQAPVNTTGQVRTFAPGAPTGEHDLQLFARYLAVVTNRGRGPTFASEADRVTPVLRAAGGGSHSVPNPAPVDWTGTVRTFAPRAPTGEHDLDLFARYLDLVANRGRGPTFASEADRGMPE